MTTYCAPKKQDECDKRYVLKIWLYGITVIAVLGSIGIVFAAGQWKTGVDYSMNDLAKRVDKMEVMASKIDTVLILLRK